MLINEDVLCYLYLKDSKKEIETAYFPIENKFETILDELNALCVVKGNNLLQVIHFLKENTLLNELNGNYNYCRSLNRPYQGENVNVFEYIEGLSTDYLESLDPETGITKLSYNTINQIKLTIHGNFRSWILAKVLSESYLKCNANKSIMAYSHRKAGWTFPSYPLTEHFKIQLKTNFGYGSVSYFYTMLTFKKVEIIPFSEWISYEYARFSEIIKYSRKYSLDNQAWIGALEFAKEACNLSLHNETEFINRYILQECEMMVSGLEDYFKRNNERIGHAKTPFWLVDKGGHALLEFKATKVGGALDFIGKILELDSIASMKSFIERIELCNQKILPLIERSLLEIPEELNLLRKELIPIQNNHDSLVAKNQVYLKSKEEITAKIQLRKIEPKTAEIKEVEREFKGQYPEYESFIIELAKEIRLLNLQKQMISNLENLLQKISSHMDKINLYFKK